MRSEPTEMQKKSQVPGVFPFFILFKNNENLFSKNYIFSASRALKWLFPAKLLLLFYRKKEFKTNSILPVTK